FPFTDLSQTKLRPAIVLWIDPIGPDIVVCAITSQKTDQIAEGEFPLNASDSEFLQTGLRVTSKARTTRIVTLDRQLVVRKLGDLGEHQHQQLNAHMIQAYQLV
ncbi:MAG: type II toxin-antitoxin system PemK/MazF family toxin, partial [Cyanobacteria bacterium J06638_6]